MDKQANQSEPLSPGEYIVNAYREFINNPDSADPIIVPGPIIDSLADYIDHERPLVNAIGTQRASSPKEECIFGGYVNVSRLPIPSAINSIAGGLASQYGIETEVAAAQAITTAGCASVDYGTDPTEKTINEALWIAAGKAYTAVKGRGRLILAIAPNMSDLFRSLLNFSGISLITSPGFLPGKAFLLSTAAMQIQEQQPRVLLALELSTSGLQLFYGGQFEPVVIQANAIVELVAP